MHLHSYQRLCCNPIIIDRMLGSGNNEFVEATRCEGMNLRGLPEQIDFVLLIAVHPILGMGGSGY